MPLSKSLYANKVFWSWRFLEFFEIFVEFFAKSLSFLGLEFFPNVQKKSLFKDTIEIRSKVS